MSPELGSPRVSQQEGPSKESVSECSRGGKVGRPRPQDPCPETALAGRQGPPRLTGAWDSSYRDPKAAARGSPHGSACLVPPGTGGPASERVREVRVFLWGAGEGNTRVTRWGSFWATEPVCISSGPAASGWAEPHGFLPSWSIHRFQACHSGALLSAVDAPSLVLSKANPCSEHSPAIQSRRHPSGPRGCGLRVPPGADRSPRWGG